MREKNYAVKDTSIAKYVSDLLNIEKDPQLAFVLEVARKRGTPPLHMTPCDGRHLEVLAKLSGASKMVEIGTLCGYSAVCLARHLPPEGKLYTCEKSTFHAQIAKEVIDGLSLQNKVEIVIGEAIHTLPTLEPHGPFDLIFIDADKINYPAYFEWSLQNLRSGGLLIADNVFAFEKITHNDVTDKNLKEIITALRDFNQKCCHEEKLLTTFLPTGEGLMVAIKK